MSGFLVRGVAKRSYTDTGYALNVLTTGVAPAAVTGLVLFPLATGDTNICPGNYIFDFLTTDLSSGRSTWPTEGLSILPSIYGS